MAKCHVCGLGPEHTVTVYRQNPVGELPSIWACETHRTKPVDPEVQKIVDAIEDKK